MDKEVGGYGSRCNNDRMSGLMTSLDDRAVSVTDGKACWSRQVKLVKEDDCQQSNCACSPELSESLSQVLGPS